MLWRMSADHRRGSAMHVSSRHPERSRPEGGAVEGPFLVGTATEKVPPLRLASLGSGRDDGWREVALTAPTPLERQRIGGLFGIDRARAAGAAGIEHEMVGDPRAGPEVRMAGHELRQVMAAFDAVGKARQCDV